MVYGLGVGDDKRILEAEGGRWWIAVADELVPSTLQEQDL